MSENSVESVSSRLEKRKQAKEQIEASFKQSINESVKNASFDWNNALQNIVTEIDRLSKNLVEKSQNLSHQQIQEAQSQIDLRHQELTDLVQSITQLSQTAATQIDSTTTTVTSELTALGQTVSDESQKVITQAQTVLQTLPQQVEQLSQQIAQQTEQTVIHHQQRLKRLNRLGLRATMVTLFEILVAVSLFGLNYYLGNQVYQTQQRLDTLQAHISQTPIEAQALSMVNIYENDGKAGGVLITPKNQLTAFWGNNQQGEKTLLVTELVSAKNTTPPKKDKPQP